MSAGVDALNMALEALATLRELAPIAGLIEGDLTRVIGLVTQGRDVLVQTEKDLRESVVSGIEAHRQLHHLQLYVAEVRRTLQELGLREAIALQNHGERVKLLTTLRGRDPEPRDAVPSFAVSTDTPRPVLAGVQA